MPAIASIIRMYYFSGYLMKELTLKLVIVLVLFFTALSDGAAQSFNYPVSDCYTYTYKLSIESSTNELLRPVKMITGSNGLSYLLGSKETALGKKEAFGAMPRPSYELFPAPPLMQAITVA